ncbi:hypothetical protein E2C01_004094 [Portunus trituberculatus]|uniref:Uncharacterized protein n=1 Tax=Portunus trituberculatus TaxID=210409 RepID=A0A5B7CNY0_PORTR|nr:hypothetical protein [Portunus trituberculatus]
MRLSTEEVKCVCVGVDEDDSEVDACDEERGFGKYDSHGNGGGNQRKRKIESEIHGRIGQAGTKKHDEWTVHKSHEG